MVFRYISPAEFPFYVLKNKQPTKLLLSHVRRKHLTLPLSTHSGNKWHSFVVSHSHLKHCWYLRSLLCQLTADSASCLLIWKMNYCLPLCSCTTGTDQRPAINCCCSSTFSSSLSQLKTWKWLQRGHLAPRIRMIERESDLRSHIWSFLFYRVASRGLSALPWCTSATTGVIVT